MQRENNTAERELRISRVLNAPVELVWEVWTDPEHLKHWWGPDGFTNTITKMEMRKGGKWNLVMHGPDGTDYQNESIIIEIIKYKKIVYDHVSGPRFLATIEFEAQGNKTRIDWHMLFETREQLIRTVKAVKADEGLKQNVIRMEQYLLEHENCKKMNRSFYISSVCIAAVLCTCKPENQSMDTNKKPDSSAVAAPSFESGYSDVNGIKMYYEIYGEGEPLVLIHGGGSTIQTSFGRILPLLAKNRKVIGVELQAHGRTGDRDTPISFEQDADDVFTLLSNLNVYNADILGFSNGGNTTMRLATRHPEVVNRIIVASAFYKRDGMFPGFWDFMKKGTMADMPAALKENFLKVNPDSAKLQNLFEKCSKRMLEFKDWNDDQLTAIKAKTLIVAGDKDVATSEHYVTMHRLIANSQLLIIPGGHGEFMGEITFPDSERKAASFVTLIEEFLE